MDKKNMTIAIAGNPNCGKTTLFNTLTGNTQKIGNWPGVTVEKKEGTYKSAGISYNVVDLPGIYSLSAHSEDEKVARDYILSGEADLIVNIVDAVNLERNLYLTTHLLEMNIPMMLVLNMKDIAETREISIDTGKISSHLNIPTEYITAINKSDIQQVKQSIDAAVKEKASSSITINYENEIEDAIAEIIPEIAAEADRLHTNPRWLAVKLLEGGTNLLKQLNIDKNVDAEKIDKYRDSIEKKVGDETDILIADARYGFIHGVIVSAVKKGTPKKTTTDKIDKIVLNRFLGIPIFLAAMYLVFWVTINLGGALIDFFDISFGAIFVDGSAVLLDKIGSPGWITAIISTGIGGGIQTLATFVPIMFMMFFMLALLEDSGYMARAAFVMDRFMRVIGLPGKAFIPMMVGFGCTVPAIMATRTLANKRDRYLTIFMTPFMSCGARLPVYALFAAAFFPKNGQTIVFALYMTGIVLAIFTGLLLKKTLFRGESAPLLMELPLYHVPRLKHIFLHTWLRLKGFIVKAGKFLIIIIAVLGFFNSLGTDGSFGNEDSENSVLAIAGKAITPIFTPFGVTKENWPASVGLFTGLFAKEVVVGTLNSLYMTASEDGAEEEEAYDLWGSLGEAFASIPGNIIGAFDPGALTDPLGTNIGDVSDSDAVAEDMEIESSIFGEMRSRFEGGPVAAFAYLLFILLYVPCLVAVAAMYKEIGLLYTVFQVVYSTVLAWIVATLFYQIVSGYDIKMIFTAVLIGLILVGSIVVFARSVKAEEIEY